MVQGGMKCVKFLLFAFNLIFFLAGLGLIIAGALVQTKFQEYFALLGTSFNAAAILLIVVGSIVFIIGFFGCCGAYKENYCMVMTFAALLGLVFILEIAAAITAYVMRDTVSSFVQGQMTQGIKNYHDDLAVQKAWNVTQSKFECCGVQAATDWCSNNATGDVPASCCNTAHGVPMDTCGQDQCPVPSDTIIYQDGCLNKLTGEMIRNIYMIAGVGIGLAFVQIIGIVIACCLGKAIRREYQVV